MTEHDRALMEGSREQCVVDYFNARPHLCDRQSMTVYEAGHDAGWKAAMDYRKPTESKTMMAGKLIVQITENTIRDLQQQLATEKAARKSAETTSAITVLRLHKTVDDLLEVTHALEMEKQRALEQKNILEAKVQRLEENALSAERVEKALNNSGIKQDAQLSKLLGYAQHKKHCYILDVFDGGNNCTCGLAELKEELKAVGAGVVAVPYSAPVQQQEDTDKYIAANYQALMDERDTLSVKFERSIATLGATQAVFRHLYNGIQHFQSNHCCADSTTVGNQYLEELKNVCRNHSELVRQEILPHQVEQSPWLPISSAPMDGTEFFATGHNNGKPANGRHYIVARYENRAFYSEHISDALMHLTHWSPITSPDLKKGESSEQATVQSQEQ